MPFTGCRRADPAGYVTMRVDKPGCGDSEGGPWPEIDFQAELDGYGQGLKALKAYSFVDPDKVFIFGHSMGGVMGPLLAAETKVKGVAVYGTVFRTWFEYQVENVRRQRAWPAPTSRRPSRRPATRRSCSPSSTWQEVAGADRRGPPGARPAHERVHH